MEEHAPLGRDPGRKTPAKGVRISLGEPTIIFLTVNAKDRVPWMAQPEVQRSLATIWRQAEAWLAGYYLLMPDHLHLFCAPRDLKYTVEMWLTYWKRQFSRTHLAKPWTWQRSGFHHRMRNRQEYHDKWVYVSENPLRRGLVERPEDWPYQGNIHDLQW